MNLPEQIVMYGSQKLMNMKVLKNFIFLFKQKTEEKKKKSSFNEENIPIN